MEIEVDILIARLHEKTKEGELEWGMSVCPRWYYVRCADVLVGIYKSLWFGYFSGFKDEGFILPIYKLYVDGHSIPCPKELLRPLYDDVIKIVQNKDKLEELRYKKYAEQKTLEAIKKVREYLK